jgi:hypothetical protein
VQRDPLHLQRELRHHPGLALLMSRSDNPLVRAIGRIPAIVQRHRNGRQPRLASVCSRTWRADPALPARVYDRHRPRRRRTGGATPAQGIPGPRSGLQRNGPPSVGNTLCHVTFGALQPAHEVPSADAVGYPTRRPFRPRSAPTHQ